MQASCFGFKDAFTYVTEKASQDSATSISEEDRISECRSSISEASTSSSAVKKYRKIVLGKLHSPLMKYLKGEGHRSFIPLSAELHVKSTDNKTEKTPEIVAMLYKQAAFVLKIKNAHKFAVSCAEDYTESIFGKWQSNLILWHEFDPHNLISLSLIQRMRIDPQNFLKRLGYLQKEEETIYKHYNFERNEVYRECHRESIAAIQEDIWKKIRQETLGNDSSQVSEALFTAREKMAKLSSKFKTHIASRVSSVLPGHSIVAVTKYAVVMPLFLVAFSAHQVANRIEKLGVLKNKA